MGVVSRRWVWVESMGVVVRRYIDFLILRTYPYSSCVCSFLQHPYFLLTFFNVFVLVIFMLQVNSIVLAM